MGSLSPARGLSTAKTAGLIELIHNKLGYSALLVGGPDEKDRGAEIMKACKAPIVNGGVTQSIRDFAAILDLCRLVIVSDGPAYHVCMALHKDTIVFVGPSSAGELDAYRCAVKIIPQDGCACLCRENCLLGESCLDRIPNDRFLRVIQGHF